MVGSNMTDVHRHSDQNSSWSKFEIAIIMDNISYIVIDSGIADAHVLWIK